MASGQERGHLGEGHVRHDDADGRHEPGGHHELEVRLLQAVEDEGGERGQVEKDGRTPERDAGFRQPVARGFGNHHQAHGEGRDDAADDRMLEVGAERVAVRRKAKRQKAEHDEADHGARRLSPAAERQGVFHAPAEACNAERETRERRGQAANLVVKLFEHDRFLRKDG